MQAWQWFLAGCVAISTIGGALAVIGKWLSPAVDFVERIETLERHQKEDYERITKNEETNRLLCKGMICLLEVAEEQTCENPTNMERIKEAKKNIQDYLIQGMVRK